MIGIAFSIIVLGLSYLYGRYRSRSSAEEDAKKLVAGTFQLPKFEEGTAVPLIYGTVKLTPIVILTDLYTATERTEEVAGDTVAVGYDYRLMMQLNFGVPGTSEVGYASMLRRLWIGERIAWQGSVTADDDIRYVRKPELLGGANAGGGVEGFISYLPGKLTQTNNGFLVEALQTAGVNTDLAYRGQCVLTLVGAKQINLPAGQQDLGYQGYIDGASINAADLAASTLLQPWGWKVGESPTVEPYTAEITAPTRTTSLGATLGSLGFDANPANVLYDLLVREFNRLHLPLGTIDAPSFLAAGQKLASESHGFSAAFSKGTEASEMINLVLDQIDGSLTVDPAAGTIGLKLFRDDYGAISGLTLINEDNAVTIDSYAVGNWNETYTTVRVTYTDRARHYLDAVAFAQNLALIVSQGRERVRDINYPGCMTRQLATQLCARELKAVARPLARLKITVNRTLYAKKAGDVFRLRWARFGIVDQVFRIMNVDLGAPGEQRVQFDCIEDVFAIDHTTFKIPPRYPNFPFPPFPSTERKVEEAPRWLALRSHQLGRTQDHDFPRALHLAIPRGNATAHRGEVTINGLASTRDMEPSPFLPCATVETSYARELEPYDTVIGLRIQGLIGLTTPPNATADQIKTSGANLIRVGEEFMTYQTATDEGGGVWLLSNVGRGHMDTVPVLHPIGERVYFMGHDGQAQVSRVGRASWQLGETVVVRQNVHRDAVVGRPTFRTITPQTQLVAPTIIAPTAVDDDVINTSTVTARTLLPYPPCDLTSASTKTPADLEEYGIDLAWKRRNRLNEVLVRGDEADEEPEFDTRYQPIARKVGDADYTAVGGGVEGDYTTTSFTQVLLAEAGYGALEVGVRAFKRLQPQDKRDPTVITYGWQSPTLTVEAPFWRNLIRDGRFVEGFGDTSVGLDDGWHAMLGVPVDASGAAGLGGAGTYSHPSTPVDTNVLQEMSVVGYNAKRLSARGHFYYKDITGGGGTLHVEIGDSLGNLQNSGALTPSATQWKHGSVFLTALSDHPADEWNVYYSIDYGTTGAIAVTEAIFRIGETDGTQLLTNPFFEGSLIGWTTASGAFALSSTAPIYEGAAYVHATGAGAGELYQEVAVPAGWECGATALLELARMDAAIGDQGEVVLEARDSLGSVLASTTTGMEHIATGTWARRRLSLVMPYGTVALRVRLLTTNHGAFDDAWLDVWKHLDPDTEIPFRFDMPKPQALPMDLDFWDRAYPTITAPTLGFWAGAFIGVIGSEPHLEADSAAAFPPFEAALFVGAYDATQNGEMMTNCLEFPDGCDSGLAVNTPDFANFKSDGSFTQIVTGKFSDLYAAGTIVSVASRLGAAGWALTIGDGVTDGVAVAWLFGDAGYKKAVGVRLVNDKCIHTFAIVYDAIAQELRLLDEDTIATTSTAAGLGEIQEEGASVFYALGDATASAWATNSLADPVKLKDSQIARSWVFDRAVDTSDVESMMTHGLVPAAGTSSYVRDGGPVCIPVRADPTVATSALWCRFDARQLPIGYTKPLADDGGTGLGLAMDRTQTNAIAPAQQSFVTGPWAAHGIVPTYRAQPGPEGFVNAVTLTGDNTGYLELSAIVATVNGTKRVGFFAQQPLSATARVELCNASGVVKATLTYTAGGVGWKFITLETNAWDSSTPTCTLRFYPSDSGVSHTTRIAGPFMLTDGSVYPSWIPTSTAPSGYHSFDLGTLPPTEYNVEGEIEVVGVVAVPTASNPGGLLVDVVTTPIGTESDVDHRQLNITSGNELQFWHGDGAGVLVQADTAALTAWDTQVWTARGRWSEAGLRERASVYTSAERDQGASVDTGDGRIVTWTPGTAGGPQRVQLANPDLAGGDDPAPTFLRSITIRTREKRL